MAAAILLVGGADLYNQLVMTAIRPLVMEQLKISSTQVSAVMMAPLICGIFFALVAGSLGDRFGPTAVIRVSLVLAIAGAVIRVFATTYLVTFIAMLLIGVAAMVMYSNVAKLYAAWFKPSQMGIAMGLTMLGPALGSTAAHLTGAKFGTPKNLYAFAAGVLVVISAYVFIAVRDRPKGAAAPVRAADAPKAKGHLGYVLRVPYIWCLGLAMFLFMGSQMTVMSFTTSMLHLGKEMSLEHAGEMSSMFSFGALLGGLLVPAVAAKIGRMKPVVMAGGLIAGVCVYLAWLAAPSDWLMACLFLAGMSMTSVPTLVTPAPAMLDRIGPERAGTAGGVLSTFQNAGGYIVPTFVVSPIAGENYTVIAIMGGVTSALVLAVLLAVPEWGHRNKSPHGAHG